MVWSFSDNRPKSRTTLSAAQGASSIDGQRTTSSTHYTKFDGVALIHYSAYNSIPIDIGMQPMLSTNLKSEQYKEERAHCLFCGISKAIFLAENEYAYAIRDRFPVTKMHSLIIPKRHVEEYFGLTNDELLGCDSLLRTVRNEILKVDSHVEGFNVGMNSGEAAGQTIFHCHIHLIPRRHGDVTRPRGGVRHVIPEKGYY